MRDIINNKEEHIPPKLYRYRDISNDKKIVENKHVDALKNEKIYLANPYNFNDPYDSAFSIDIEVFKNILIERAEQQLKEQILKQELEKNYIDLSQIENPDTIYDDINIDMSGAHEFFENNMHIFYEELIKQIKFKISCFSETQKSILMWSHYAHQHQGICIGYDTLKIDEKIKNNIYPVFYHDTFFPLIPPENEINNRKFNSLIKFKDWRYEKEWRLISNEQFIHLKPSKIYLGVRFNMENVDIFKDIARDKNCRLYKMKMDYSKYALECEEIDL